MQQHGSKYFAHRHTSSTLGWGQKVKPYLSESSHVAYQIKGAPDESKYAVITHTLDHWGGVKRSNIVSESGHVAYQIKVKEV